MPSRVLETLALAVTLSLLTGACGVPIAVTAASYAGDGVLVVTTKKTSADHFASMVTKEDCSFWRIFRHQKICKERPEGSPDPYHVTQDATLFAGAAGAESGTIQEPSAAASAAAPTAPVPAQKPATAVAELEAQPLEPAPVAAAKKKVAAPAKVRKPSPNQVASAR